MLSVPTQRWITQLVLVNVDGLLHLERGALNNYLTVTTGPLHLFDWQKRAAPDSLRAFKSLIRIGCSTDTLRWKTARSSQAASCARELELRGETEVKMWSLVHFQCRKIVNPSNERFVKGNVFGLFV
jgi:hypothetical protein